MNLHLPNTIHGWINWRSILTSLTLVLILFIGAEVRAFYREAQSSHEQTQQNSDVLKKIVPLLEKIAGKIEEIDYRHHTMTGLGRILSGGADEGYISVNELSDAHVFVGEAEVRVTNLSSENRLSVVCKVNGSFSDSRERLLAMLSRKAADRLGAAGEIRIRLELVKKN